MQNIDIDDKKIKNLYNALISDQNSIFYATTRISKNLINWARKSLYPKDKVFVNIYQNFNEKETSLTELPPVTTLFVPQRKDVDRSTLYNFKDPFEVLQADIADIRFLARSVVNAKYCLLFADLFTSMIYTYPMKTWNLLARKMTLFYNDIKNKRMGRMRLQTDVEFQ